MGWQLQFCIGGIATVLGLCWGLWIVKKSQWKHWHKQLGVAALCALGILASSILMNFRKTHLILDELRELIDLGIDRAVSQGRLPPAEKEAIKYLIPSEMARVVGNQNGSLNVQCVAIAALAAVAIALWVAWWHERTKRSRFEWWLMFAVIMLFTIALPLVGYRIYLNGRPCVPFVIGGKQSGGRNVTTARPPDFIYPERA